MRVFMRMFMTLYLTKHGPLTELALNASVAAVGVPKAWDAATLTTLDVHLIFHPISFPGAQ